MTDLTQYDWANAAIGNVNGIEQHLRRENRELTPGQIANFFCTEIYRLNEIYRNIMGRIEHLPNADEREREGQKLAQLEGVIEQFTQYSFQQSTAFADGIHNEVRKHFGNLAQRNENVWAEQRCRQEEMFQELENQHVRVEMLGAEAYRNREHFEQKDLMIENLVKKMERLESSIKHVAEQQIGGSSSSTKSIVWGKEISNDVTKHMFPQSEKKTEEDTRKEEESKEKNKKGFFRCRHKIP